ncbi:MAG: winged helix-turn-helix transcriptional regulator [Anaerolineales bacterium]|nr:winged helix-turn-helix transcriptional regulator [Anaerolineales bacterium]
MRSTRDKILQTLLKKPKSTIADLAEAVGINQISVRHHLTNLQMEGLVEAQEVRHGVGRPRLIYRLTEEGMERFPTRYLRLTTRLLAQMKENIPQPMVNKLFGQMAEDLASEYASDIKGLSLEDRLDFVQDMLAEEGFTVEWEKQDGEYKIHEITCPYYQVGVAHPEICTMDQTLISKMLALPANRVQCILNGDTRCTYVVQAEKTKSKPK